MLNVTILGGTGSIGASTLAVLKLNPQAFSLRGFSFGNNAKRAAEICREFSPKWVCASVPKDAVWLAEQFPHINCFSCVDELDVRVAEAQSHRIVAAVTGFAGLRSLIAAIKSAKRILLANKESLVAAGSLVMPMVNTYGARLLPIDSEHNALFQCIQAQDQQGIQSMTLTASGGALRSLPLDQLANAGVEQALAHPNWSMGKKVTIDSATMMNKGFELIEAHWLFGLKAEALKVLIHPQSIVHAMVSYRDGSSLAQLGYPDMRTPIAHALGFPQRVDSGVETLDLSQQNLSFESVDSARYPLFELARSALATGGDAGLSLNAANEVAVDAFLSERINFDGMRKLIEQSIQHFPIEAFDTLEALEEKDSAVRHFCCEKLKEFN